MSFVLSIHPLHISPLIIRIMWPKFMYYSHDPSAHSNLGVCLAWLAWLDLEVEMEKAGQEHCLKHEADDTISMDVEMEEAGQQHEADEKEMEKASQDHCLKRNADDMEVETLEGDCKKRWLQCLNCQSLYIIQSGVPGICELCAQYEWKCCGCDRTYYLDGYCKVCNP